VDTLNGIVIKAQSGFFTVRSEAGRLVVCHLRGRLKQKRQRTDLATIGDRVTISEQPDGTGMIESVAPRHSVLVRRAPTGAGRSGRRAAARDKAQVIIANPDQAVFVFACAEPAPRLGALDRFLVMAEAERLPAVICANKVDLVTPAQAEALFGIYPPLGYPVLFTSARQGTGVAELRERLRGRLSVLAGPSGAGKSSLLNALQPGLGLRAKAVSRATQKGRHTTVYPELLPLEAGGFVADTPGMRALALWDVEPAELDGYFVEIKPLVAGCTFNNCTHLSEPGCAVRAALAAGRIAPSRYQSYCRLRLGEGNTGLAAE
jgi:ribosome biogenesis GTPase